MDKRYKLKFEWRALAEGCWALWVVRNARRRFAGVVTSAPVVESNQLAGVRVVLSEFHVWSLIPCGSPDAAAVKLGSFRDDGKAAKKAAQMVVVSELRSYRREPGQLVLFEEKPIRSKAEER